MTHGHYRVIGSRRYRGHEPGTEFIAEIAPVAEHRAVRRGDILLLERVEPALLPGSFEFPQGWLASPNTPVQRGAERLLSR